MKQVFEKIKVNSKFVNSYIYFTKDFIYFYFSCKKLKNNQKIIFESLSDVKNEFLLKFKEALIDNFSRAFKLVETIQKSIQSDGGEFEKEKIVNINIVEYIADYIKKISQSFTDLYIEFAFTNEDPLFYSNQDSLINEMGNIFKDEINNHYLIPIYNIIDNLFNLLEKEEIKGNTKEKIYIQLIYFNNYILYKMNEVLNAFMNSNISYLIKKSLIISNKERIININTKLFKLYKQNFSNKLIISNLSNKDYTINIIKEISKKTKLYFGDINHNNNLFYEQNLIENCLYCYFLCCINILLVKGTFGDAFIDTILDNLINNISKELIGINHSDVIIKFNEFIKLLSGIESIEKLDEYKIIIGKSKVKKILFNIKKIIFNQENVIKFLENKKITQSEFINILVIMLMNSLRCNSEEEIDFYLGKKQIINKNINDIEKELFDN